MKPSILVRLAFLLAFFSGTVAGESPSSEYFPMTTAECNGYRNNDCGYLYCVCLVGLSPQLKNGLGVDSSQMGECYSTYLQCSAPFRFTEP